MLLACEAQRPLFGIVEVDESFFGARRVKGRRGRGAYGKTIVFGIFERQGRVYTEIVPDGSKPTLQGIIRGRVEPAHRQQLRWLARLPRPCRSCPRRVHQGTRPYQRHRRLLGPSQGPADQVQGPGRDTPSTSISRRPNGATTIATPTSTHTCYSTYARTRSARHDPRSITTGIKGHLHRRFAISSGGGWTDECATSVRRTPHSRASTTSTCRSFRLRRVP